MKDFAYVNETRKKSKIRIFRNGTNIPGAGSESAGVQNLFMMQRPDFDVKIVELPPVPEHTVPDILKYRLRSLYPGDPAGTAFDYKILTFRKKHYAVLFITRKKTLEKYRKESDGKALVLPFSCIKSHLLKNRKENAFFLFWHRDWVEVISLKNSAPVSSHVFKRGRSLKSDFLKLEKLFPSGDVLYDCVNFCGAGEKQLLDEQYRVFFPERERTFFLFREVFRNRISKADTLFTPARKNVLPPLKHRIAAYAAVLFLLLGLLYNRNIENIAAYRSYLETRYRELLSRNQNINRIKEEAGALEKEFLMLKGKKPVNIYFLLSELYGELTSRTTFSSFSIKGAAFQAEGFGHNPLVLEERLKKNPLFKEIEILEIKPVPNSLREYFRMKGTFNTDYETD